MERLAGTAARGWDHGMQNCHVRLWTALADRHAALRSTEEAEQGMGRIAYGDGLRDMIRVEPSTLCNMPCVDNARVHVHLHKHARQV